MAMQFYESANGTGIVDLLGDLTSSSLTSYSLAKRTRDINNAYANFLMLAQRYAGRTQVDDTNQDGYPIVKYNIVSGQRDYLITVDGEATPNQIQDIMRVECAGDSTGVLKELSPFDMSDERTSLGTAIAETGSPERYDKFAGALWLDKTPNFNSTASTTSGGLWIWVNRTPEYFTTSDTTKKPGIPDQFHEYLAYRPAYLFAARHGLPSTNAYLNFLTRMEADMKDYYGLLNKDDRKFISSEPISFR